MSALRIDAAERHGWRGRAEAYRRGFGRLSAYTARPLLSATRVDTGARILDVGCGPGIVTDVAVALGHRVLAVDVDSGMARVTAERLPSTEVVQAALPQLPFDDGRFDAAVGNYVINHTADPPAAVRELRRVLRPGGRLALTCWRYPEMRANTVFADAVRAAGAGPADDPDDYPFHRFGHPARFAGLLGDAGLTQIHVTTLRWSHRVDGDRWWADIVAGTARHDSLLQGCDAATAERVRAEYRRLVARYDAGDGQVALPACALLASGRR